MYSPIIHDIYTSRALNIGFAWTCVARIYGVLILRKLALGGRVTLYTDPCRTRELFIHFISSSGPFSIEITIKVRMSLVLKEGWQRGGGEQPTFFHVHTLAIFDSLNGADSNPPIRDNTSPCKHALKTLLCRFRFLLETNEERKINLRIYLSIFIFIFMLIIIFIVRHSLPMLISFLLTLVQIESYEIFQLILIISIVI